MTGRLILCVLWVLRKLSLSLIPYDASAWCRLMFRTNFVHLEGQSSETGVSVSVPKTFMHHWQLRSIAGLKTFSIIYLGILLNAIFDT